MEYAFILLVVILVGPLVLRLASYQDKKNKDRVKTVFLSILAIQLILGFLNWEKFGGVGRSGYELSLTYTGSFLGLFFALSAFQFFLLVLNKLSSFVIVLNFINSVLIFTSMIRLSSILGFQVVSLPSIGAVFLVLFGNVVGLSLINKDKNLLKRYFR